MARTRAAAVRAAVAVETRPGWKTTEFWIVVLTNVGIIGGQVIDVLHLPPRYAELGLVVVNAAYAIARGLAKTGVPNVVPETPSITSTSSAPTSERVA